MQRSVLIRGKEVQGIEKQFKWISSGGMIWEKDRPFLCSRISELAQLDKADIATMENSSLADGIKYHIIYIDLKGVFINLCLAVSFPFRVMLYVLWYEFLVGLLTVSNSNNGAEGKRINPKHFPSLIPDQRRSLQDMLILLRKQILHNIEYNTMKCT